MNTKGQMGYMFVVVGVLVAFIALILVQSMLSTATMANWTTGGGNSGLIATIVGYFVPLLAIGLLVAVAATAIGSGKR
jgi:uncharacterized membrane protein YphA (DoxX/SURF4 family)